MLHFPQNLKLIRLVSGLTQPDFGALFDATKAMIVSYEKGKASPDALFMSRLSKYAGVPVEALINRALTEEDLSIDKVDKLDKVYENGQKKPDLEGPDWQGFALKMEKLAQSWEHLCDSQRIFIDQIRDVSFNWNKLLSDASVLQGEAASARPAAADELLQTGRSGPYQISTRNVPEGSSTKKDK